MPALIIALVVGWWAPVFAAAPGDLVRDRFAGSFSQALVGYERLGKVAVHHAEQGLVPLGGDWVSDMKTTDDLLIPLERVFFPMMNRPWSRESAVFVNLQSARMWLWSIRDGLDDGPRGVDSLDVVDGRVRAELLSNFQAYLVKARSLLAGGEFKGTYFEDTLAPILADYCTYPEDGKQHHPDFNDPHLFDDVKVAPATGEGRI